MSLRIPVIYGSVRSERQGIKAARFMERRLRDRGHDVTLIDPMVTRLPMLDRMYKEYAGDAPAEMQRLAELYRKADGFLIVSGEYNNGIPPALKNLLDHFLEEYFWRPSAILCYSAGQFGGVRAAMQLRMTLAEMGMSSIPSILAVPKVATAFNDEGQPVSQSLASQTDRFLDEFEWYAKALAHGRQGGTPY